MRPFFRRSRLLALGAVPVVLLLAACSSTVPESAQKTPEAAAKITISHAQGDTVVDMNPQTVVVFDAGYLSTLDDLGVEVAGVPTGITLPKNLEKYTTDAYAKVGTLFEPDYEAVNALDPDLVIVAGRSAAAYPELAKMYPTVDLSVDQTDFYASVSERSLALASIFGLEDAVTERLSALDTTIAETKAAAAKSGQTGLITLTTGGEVSVYGPGSRFGMIHDLLGVTPADPNIEEATHGDAVSFEFIATANPDILYVIDRDATIGEDGQSAKQVLDNAIVGTTTAWKNGDVVYLDGFAWYLAPSALSSVENMVTTVADSLS